MRALLLWIDAGEYHARRGPVDLKALAKGFIRHGRYGWTLTVKGSTELATFAHIDL